MKRIVLSVVLFGLISACDSKFVEPPPSSVKVKGITLNERLSQKGQIDTKISQVEEAAQKAKAILSMFRKIASPSSSGDVYTPLDFVLDVNRELKKKIPESVEDHLVRRGKIIVRLSRVPEDCREIETILESSDLSKEEDGGNVSRLIYSLKTCRSKNHYLPLLEATWKGSTMELRLVKESLVGLFSDEVTLNSDRGSVCRIGFDTKSVVEGIECENIDVRLSVSEVALIKVLKYSGNGSVRLECNADIYENGEVKGKLEFRLGNNGKVDFVETKAGGGDSPIQN